MNNPCESPLRPVFNLLAQVVQAELPAGNEAHAYRANYKRPQNWCPISHAFKWDQTAHQVDTFRRAHLSIPLE